MKQKQEESEKVESRSNNFHIVLLSVLRKPCFISWPTDQIWFKVQVFELEPQTQLLTIFCPHIAPVSVVPSHQIKGLAGSQEKYK